MKEDQKKRSSELVAQNLPPLAQLFRWAKPTLRVCMGAVFAFDCACACDLNFYHRAIRT